MRKGPRKIKQKMIMTITRQIVDNKKYKESKLIVKGITLMKIVSSQPKLP
jgi:hypothetical protein